MSFSTRKTCRFHFLLEPPSVHLVHYWRHESARRQEKRYYLVPHRQRRQHRHVFGDASLSPHARQLERTAVHLPAGTDARRRRLRRTGRHRRHPHRPSPAREPVRGVPALRDPPRRDRQHEQTPVQKAQERHLSGNRQPRRRCGGRPALSFARAIQVVRLPAGHSAVAVVPSASARLCRRATHARSGRPGLPLRRTACERPLPRRPRRLARRAAEAGRRHAGGRLPCPRPARRLCDGRVDDPLRRGGSRRRQRSGALRSNRPAAFQHRTPVRRGRI